jgi:hypothetical protein
MRWSLAALVTALVASSPAAASSSGDGAFCINGFNYDGGLGDCSYSSYEQCQATASGTANSCLANPYYHAKVEIQPGRERPASRRRN